MRALIDRPRTLPVAALVLAAAQVSAAVLGEVPGERLAGALLLSLAIGVGRLLPGLAGALAVLGAGAGGAFPAAPLAIDAVVAGIAVAWCSARYGGRWCRALTLAGLALGPALAAVATALPVPFPPDPGATSGAMVVVVSTLAIVTVLVTAWLAGVGSRRDRPAPVEEVHPRLLRRTDPLHIASDTTYALLFLLVAGFPFAWSGTPEPFVAGLFAVAIALRRRATAASLAVAWVAAAIQVGAVLAPSLSDFAVLVVLFANGAHGGSRTRKAGLASALVGGAVATVYLSAVDNTFFGSATHDLLQIGFIAGSCYAALGLSWTAGYLLGVLRRAHLGRAAQAEAEAERARAQRELDAVEERNRIARDMHDVVAHSLAVVIAQADGARYLGTTRPELTDTALATISGVARDALGDVRVLLERLRHSQADVPQPDASDLPALLDAVVQAGVPVERRISIDLAAVPRTAGLALYRIVQEATTNALRHGRPGALVSVALYRDGDGVGLRVRNELRADDSPAPGGHGLIGMAERAAIAGGTLRAEPEGGAFVVEARVPATGPVPTVLTGPVDLLRSHTPVLRSEAAGTLGPRIDPGTGDPRRSPSALPFPAPFPEGPHP